MMLIERGQDLNLSSYGQFKARFKVLVSLPWRGRDRFGVLWDRQDRSLCFCRFGPNDE